MNVVVFSGTTEGRELSRQLAALGIEVTVSVATRLVTSPALLATTQ